MNTPLTPQDSQFAQTQAQVQAQGQPQPGVDELQQAEAMKRQAEELSAQNQKSQAELKLIQQQAKQQEIQNKIKDHYRTLAEKKIQEAKEKANALDESLALASPATQGVEGGDVMGAI